MTSKEDQYIHKLDLMTDERNEWMSRALKNGKEVLRLNAIIEQLEREKQELKQENKRQLDKLFGF